MNLPDNMQAKNSAKEPPIFHELGNAEEIVEILAKVVESLEQRLMPILSAPTPETETISQDREALSPIATRLETIGSRLRQIKGQLNNITDRIEL